MPRACYYAASGVIGSELFIAVIDWLQIYDITTRTWRFGAPLPETRVRACGVVADGKFFLIGSSPRQSTFVYDPQSNTWTDEAVPWGEGGRVSHACAHKPLQL